MDTETPRVRRKVDEELVERFSEALDTLHREGVEHDLLQDLRQILGAVRYALLER